MHDSISISPSTTVHFWTYHPTALRTVILVHGFTGNHDGFQYIIPLLPHIRFIVPDLPGFGRSSIGKDDWSIDAIARLTNEFVSRLKLDTPPNILGHSMGGLVVSSMLGQAPKLYDKRAILLSPVPSAIKTNDSRRSGAILNALQYRVGHSIPKIGPRIVKSRFISKIATELITTTTDKTLKRAIREHHYENLENISGIEFYSKLHHDINRHGSIDHADALNKFKLLLIVGDKDNVAPLSKQKKLAIAIKPEKLIILQGVGHLAHYERAKEVTDAIREFLL